MGDREDRFRAVFEACYAPLWAYARRRAQAADAEDLVADVLTVAWRRLDDVPDGDRALLWLYGVAHLTLANQRSSERRRLRLADRLNSQVAPPGDDEGGPDLAAALQHLRPGDQEVLRLAAWEQLGAAEIAVVLGAITSAGEPLDLQEGTRLLVAGDGGFAWGCGFTQPHDPVVADQWANALSD